MSTLDYLFTLTDQIIVSRFWRNIALVLIVYGLDLLFLIVRKRHMPGFRRACLKLAVCTAVMLAAFFGIWWCILNGVLFVAMSFMFFEAIVRVAVFIGLYLVNKPLIKSPVIEE